MAVEVLTASLLESIVKGIFSILAKKMPSKEELQKARADLGRLVKLAQDTGYSLGCYFEVERAAIRAGVHATELRQFFSEGATPSSRLLESLTSLLEDRVKRGLGKDGLRKIHEFRDDFENVRRLVDATQKNLKGSISHLKDGKRDEALDYLDAAADELDQLVDLVATKRDQISKPLVDAYTVLVQLSR